MNPNAPSFVPSTPPPAPVVRRSAGYLGNAGDVENITNMFLQLQWPQGVHTIYITNGWHSGFENGGWVTYCGYKINDDHYAPKQHFYLGH